MIPTNIRINNIMREFASRTGLSDANNEPKRYLWTDAFAVCNFLELYRQSSQTTWLDQAKQLVNQVHDVLGKYHKDSERQGWLSGLDNETARQHPTMGGLRIGKPLKERQPKEPFDSSLEWERDGQYLHYLTKWAHALHSIYRATEQPYYQQWAMELMSVCYAAFSYTDPTGDKRLYWKMSTDLSRPLVPSIGQHDPLDGLLTCMELEATKSPLPEKYSEQSLKPEIDELKHICIGQRWATNDALGIGGLLTDAYRIVQLITLDFLYDTSLLDILLNDIIISLKAYINENSLGLPASYRLAFRELGLAIGLQAINLMLEVIQQYPTKFRGVNRTNTLLEQLNPYIPIYQQINNFWLQKISQDTPSWVDHEDINSVMLASSLSPHSYLAI
jgi:hypothetical protein